MIQEEESRHEEKPNEDETDIYKMAEEAGISPESLENREKEVGELKMKN